MKIYTMIPCLLAVLLVGCVPIRVVPKYNPDIYAAPPMIQGYQKEETIGHTDVKQREQDLFACGVRNLNDGTLDMDSIDSIGVNSKYAIEFIDAVDARRNMINSCMGSKGYILINPLDCVYKGKSNGRCN